MTGQRARAVVVLVAAAVACLVAALAWPGAAGAARSESVAIALGGAPFSEQPIGGLLNVDGIAPGQQRGAAMGVRSGMQEPSELMLRMTEVRDRENGCNEPERQVDHSCGNGPGELGDALRFTILVAPSQHGTYVQRWTGAAAELEHGIDAKVAFNPGETRWVEMTASLPFSVGNVIETDSFGFGLSVVLQATQGIAGVTLHRGGGSSTGIGGGGTSGTGSGFGIDSLSITGVPSTLLLGGALVLGAAGFVLLLAGRRRDRRSAPAP